EREGTNRILRKFQREQVRSQITHLLQCYLIVLLALTVLLVEIRLQVPDAQFLQVYPRIIIKRCIRERLIEPVGPIDGLENDGAILDGPADRPELVHRPAQRHGAMTADTAETRTQTRSPATLARRDNRTQRLGADAEGNQTGGGGGAGPGRRSARALTEPPRVARHA